MSDPLFTLLFGIDPVRWDSLDDHGDPLDDYKDQEEHAKGNTEELLNFLEDSETFFEPKEFRKRLSNLVDFLDWLVWRDKFHWMTFSGYDNRKIRLLIQFLATMASKHRNAWGKNIDDLGSNTRQFFNSSESGTIRNELLEESELLFSAIKFGHVFPDSFLKAIGQQVLINQPQPQESTIMTAIVTKTQEVATKQVTAHTTAVVAATKLEIGRAAILLIKEQLRPHVPVMVTVVLDTPIADLAIASSCSVLATVVSDDPRAKIVSEAMLTVAYGELLQKMRLPELMSGVISKIPAKLFDVVEKSQQEQE